MLSPLSFDSLINPFRKHREMDEKWVVEKVICGRHHRRRKTILGKEKRGFFLCFLNEGQGRLGQVLSPFVPFRNGGSRSSLLSLSSLSHDTMTYMTMTKKIYVQSSTENKNENEKIEKLLYRKVLLQSSSVIVSQRHQQQSCLKVSAKFPPSFREVGIF